MFTHIEWNFNILLSGKRGDQIVCLEDHADLIIAYGCQFPFGHRCDIDAIDEDLAAGGIIKARDDTQQRAFAGAGGADNRDKIAAEDLEADAFKNIDAFTTKRQAFRDVAYVHHDFVFVYGKRCGGMLYRRCIVHGRNWLLYYVREMAANILIYSYDVLLYCIR